MRTQNASIGIGGLCNHVPSVLLGLRDYGVSGQLGLEKTPGEYVAKLVEIFREVRRVLKNEGTLWLNLGDSYAAGGNGGGTEKRDSNRGTRALTGKAKKAPEGLKPKDLVGIPWMVAFALRADGWYLRQDIIWAKPNPMPESVTDRCTKSHEYIFLMSKNKKYFYDAEAIKENGACPDPRMVDGFVPKSDNGKHNGKPQSASERHKNLKQKGQKPNTIHIERARKQDMIGNPTYTGFNDRYVPRQMRNKRDVWTVTTSPFPDAHFATFPEKLIEPMVLAGCPKGGTVLDPFMGAGTTGVVAKKLGRDWLGIELNEDYIKMAEKRIQQTPSPLL